ncbi:unnamed protein product, partial [Brachionus calyciflorus]
RNEFDNGTNDTLFLKEFRENLIDFPEYGEYIGCFAYYTYLDLRKELFLLNISAIIPKVCAAECKIRNYTYVLIGEDFCRCSMKFGSLIAINNDFCECVCVDSPDSFCGCHSYFLVYKIKNRPMFEITQAIYKGCFDSVYKYSGIYISYNNNGICLKNCQELGFKYFSTHNG